MSKIKSAVCILTGDAAVTHAAPIKDPRFGPMLPGPEYDRYAELRDYQAALVGLLRDLGSLNVTRTDALPRIADLEAHPQTATSSIRDRLAELRAVLAAPVADINLAAPDPLATAIARLRDHLSPLDFGVSDLAYAVPKPSDPKAPKRDPGQRLGTGSRWGN